MSKTRCAKTVPTSVAHASLRRSWWRVSTATRASSPIRPGSTAFAKRPTPKAEKTSRKDGVGGGIASLITRSQARCPRHDRDEIEGDRGHHPLPGDEPEGVGDEVPLRAAPDEEPDHHSERGHDQRQPSPRRPRGTSRGDRAFASRPGLRRPRRAAGRCDPTSSAPARSCEPRDRAPCAAARPRAGRRSHPRGRPVRRGARAGRPRAP